MAKMGLRAAMLAAAAVMAAVQPSRALLFESPCLSDAIEGDCAIAVNLCNNDPSCSAALAGTYSNDTATAAQYVQALVTSDLGGFVAACTSCSSDECEEEMGAALLYAFGGSEAAVNATLAGFEDFCPITQSLPDLQCIFSTCASEMLACVGSDSCYGYLQQLMSTSDLQELAAIFGQAISNDPLILDGLTCSACECPNDLSALLPNDDLVTSAQVLCSSTSAPTPSTAATQRGTTAMWASALLLTAFALKF